MSENMFKITIEGPGMNVNKELPESKVLQVLAIAFPSTSSQPPSADAMQTPDGASQGTNPSQSAKLKQAEMAISEFLADLKIGNNAEKIAAVVLYLKEQRDQPLTSRDELPNWFQKAGEAIPKNITRDLATAVKQRLVAEDHTSAGHYYVTGTGEKALRSSEKSSS